MVDNGTTEAYDLHPMPGCYDAIATSMIFEGFSFSVDAAVMGDITNCTLEIPNKSQIWVGIGNMWYPFNLTPGKPEIIIVTREDAGDQRQVFMDGVVPDDRGKATTGSEYCEPLSHADCDNDELCRWSDLKSQCFVSCSSFYGQNKEGCTGDGCCAWIGRKKRGICVNQWACK